MAEQGERESALSGPSNKAEGSPYFFVEIRRTPSREEISDYCERSLRELANSDHDVVLCDLRSITAPDMVVVELLARLQLEAGRSGRSLQLQRACPELQELLNFTGLDDVLPIADDVRRNRYSVTGDAFGKAEQRK